MSQFSISKPQVSSDLALLGKELFRKAIHSSIVVVIPLSFYNIYLAFFLLSSGAIFYLSSERIRIEGYDLPLLGKITALASRRPEQQSIIWGPVTLAVGVMMALTFFSPLVASMAILSLAFGDSAASLVGRAVGYHRPSFLCGKSIEGSLACFFATFIAVYCFNRDILLSFTIATISMIGESLPLKSLDNIVIPLSTGLAATLFLLLS